MASISCIIRGSTGSQTTLWSYSAQRERNLEDADHDFTITGTTILESSTAISAPSSWRIATASIKSDDVPARFQSSKRRRAPFAALAIRLGKSHAGDLPPSFYSTLPLPMLTTLPVHVNASFDLSSDRRHIRLDSLEKDLQDYNSWLLKDVIPPLYLFTLESLLLDGEDNQQWWPTAKDEPVSQLLVDEFYSNHLKHSRRRIFHNVQHPAQPLAPQEVVLSGDEPPAINRALGRLASPGLAQLSSAARKLAENAGIARVDPTFLRHEILRFPETFTTNVDFRDLEEVISYLTKTGESTELLSDLPILPLEDGSFGAFKDPATGPLYYIWKPKDRLAPLQFPLNRFVHHDFKVKKLRRLETNISKLDPSSITALIADHLAGYSNTDSLSIQEAAWISSFWDTWDEYASLGLTWNDITSYCLIPTIRHGCFVSLEQCKQGIAWLFGGQSRETELLGACLNTLGLKVVRRDDEPTPAALRPHLRSEEYPQVRFKDVLLALAQSQVSIAQLFDLFDEESKGIFASWARLCIEEVPDDLLQTAQQLPIWLATGNETTGGRRVLLTASDVHMLPQGLRTETAGNFLDVHVVAYGTLKYMRGPSLSFSDVQARLRLPEVLDAAGLSSYKAFFSDWSAHLPPLYTDPLPVPAESLAIKLSNQLYFRDPLFVAAFGNDPEKFVHPEFEEFEAGLLVHGLHSQNYLDVDMFITCAGALDLVNDDSKVHRADVLFETYCISLPLRVDADDLFTWRQLDDMPFIPRRLDFYRRATIDENPGLGLEIPANISTLPEVVSPCELVRGEYESAAWSQRACFVNQPHPRILLAYPELGRPSFSEVVR